MALSNAEIQVMAHYLAAAENFIRFNASPKYKQIDKFNPEPNKMVQDWIATLRLPTSFRETYPSVSTRRWWDAHTKLVVSGLEKKLCELSRIAVIRGLAHSGFYHYWNAKKDFPLFIPVSIADTKGDEVYAIAMVTEEPPPANQFEHHIEHAQRWLVEYIRKQMLESSPYVMTGLLATNIGDNTIALVEIYSLSDTPEYLDCLLDAGIDHAEMLVSKLAKAS